MSKSNHYALSFRPLVTKGNVLNDRNSYVQ